VEVRIDPEASTPPYEQVRLQVVDLVATGGLPPGSKLPTVRALASELGLAVNTVARAYRELEHDGVVETRGRQGTYVALDDDRAHREAFRAAQAYADRIGRLGLGPEEGLRLVAVALRADRMPGR
jgi:DNA-binding transcriptional regulator YhcF (GntR family)